MQVVRDNKATKGLECSPLPCAEAKLGDGNLTGMYFEVTCVDKMPPKPGTPESGPVIRCFNDLMRFACVRATLKGFGVLLTGHTVQGWYLIEETWFNNKCKDSGLDPNMRIAMEHGCVPSRSILVFGACAASVSPPKVRP
jgi:hypothetical protein